MASPSAGPLRRSPRTCVEPEGTDMDLELSSVKGTDMDLERSSVDLPEGADVDLALAAPPRPSELLVPPSLGVCGSGVLAADPSSILLSSSNPQSLRTSGPSSTQESRSTFDFDGVLDSFCGAYGAALEFHRLSRIALEYLNRKKKPEDNMYKFSERLFLQTFEEDNQTSVKKYAHMNFYADTGSRKVLVFAEFKSDAICDEDLDEWTLSSCKILTRSCHGGLYGEDANVRQSKVAKKRKRSTYCFACAPEILHPLSGFEGVILVLVQCDCIHVRLFVLTGGWSYLLSGMVPMNIYV